MIRAEHIGGGFVRRTFKMGETQVYAGRPLSREEILAMPSANRAAMIEKKMIEVYPIAPGQPAASATPQERFMVKGFGGQYNVIEGRKINQGPLTKAEAEALCQGAEVA